MQLELMQLEKKYGEKQALKPLNFVFEEGIYGLLGANGAGKSTLMNLLTDNIRRTGGKILFNRQEILELGVKYRSEVGYMPQQQGIYDQFSGEAFLYYMAELKEIPRRERKKVIPELLEVVNLTEHASKKIAGYSGGMKQRILLAQALLGNPSILILDEPTAGLDPKERIRLRNYIARLGKEKIVLIATHIVSDVESIADEILLMKQGTLIAHGRPDVLLEQAKSYVTNPVLGKISLEDVYLHYLDDEPEEKAGVY